MLFAFVIVYVSIFEYLFVHQCVVVQLSVSYGKLRTHGFLNFSSLVIREKDEFIFFLKRVQPLFKNPETC